MGILSGLLDLLYPPKCPFCGRAGRSENGKGCSQCREAAFWLPLEDRVVSGENFARCVCVGRYEDPLRLSVRRFKFQGRREYAGEYGAAMADAARLFLPGAYEVITWMPVSEKRLKERGYDQARLLAEAMAERLRKPALPLLEKVRDNPAQSSLKDGRDRKRNVAGAYRVPDLEPVAGRRILLVDDILTTGATLEEGARTLRAAGARQVVAAVLCHTPEKQ